MNPTSSRIDLLIDIFELARQRAQALPSLTPAELVRAVLEEFGEFEFLGQQPADYRLARADNNTMLDEQLPIGQQLAPNDRLVLVERELSLPSGTRRPSQATYVREMSTGAVTRLHWLPAIIGRPDTASTHNALLAVNLTNHPSGLRVSRRHAQIVEENGQFFVEALSPNPTLIKDAQGQMVPVNEKRHILHHGDIISLERSQILLKFLVRATG